MKVTSAILLFLIFDFVAGWGVQVGKDRFQGRSATFDRFGTCPGVKVPIIISQQGMRIEGRIMHMNCTLDVKEDILCRPTLTIRIKRCKSRENLDTCEDFHTFPFNNYCEMIEGDNELWNPFFKTIKPKWKCPLKKGLYTSTNSSFDVAAFLLFPNDGWFWKVAGEMHDPKTNRLLMCAKIDAQVGMSQANANSRKRHN